MTTTTDAPAPPPRPPAPTGGDRVRTVLRGLGEGLITLGLIVLLFVAYEVWITNIGANRNNDRHIADLRHDYDTVTGNLPLPGNARSTTEIGSGIGILYLPRLGRDYAEAIVEGDEVPDDAQLEQGVAHYHDTQLPGQRGNFAVAGHRVGKGEPFLNLDQLRAGDPVVVETKAAWYVYRVLGSPAGGNPQTADRTPVRTKQGTVMLPGREIVTPDDGDVLTPVPDHPTLAADQADTALMTMTTCHPKFTASHRMIVYARLAATVRAQGATMPPAITALYATTEG